MSTDHRQADETSNVAADDDDEAMSNELTEPLLEQTEDGLPCASRLLLFRPIYFLSGLSGSTWGRFGVIYYNQVKHLSTEQIGILQGLLRLMGFVTSPLWGYVADMI
jgi:hypothetical protein